MELKRLTDVELEELLCEVEAAGFHRQISAYAELQEYRKAEALKQSNPPQLFVCGVIDEDGDCRRVSDEEAQFFTIYRQRADGASYALIDCHSRERAEYLLGELTVTSTSATMSIPKEMPDCVYEILYKKCGDNACLFADELWSVIVAAVQKGGAA